MNDVMLQFLVGVVDGRMCQRLAAGWVVADASWLMQHGCLFRRSD